MLSMGVLGFSLVCVVHGAGVARAQVVSPATADLQKAQGGAATPGAAAVQSPTAAQGPAASAVPANPFPAPNLKNFTAASPTRAEVDSFLKVLWGYEPNRIWSVAAILTTPAPGVSKIVILVGDKTQPGKVAQTVMFTTPDGKHAIADSVIDFGAKPFAASRAALQQSANGPARGAPGKALELVEFADLQCPKCKDAQETMDRLSQDFPEAHIVYQNFPLTEPHPFAYRAATIGTCVRKAKGDAAFFTYAQDVYTHQAALTAANANDTLAAAARSAGADPKSAGECADTQGAKDEVDASLKLGTELGIGGTPTLAVNGRMLPMTSIPYELLKRIVAYQAGQDGVQVHLQPSLTTLK